MNTTLEPTAAAATAEKSGLVSGRGAFDPNRANQIKIKTILVPLDFSRASMDALKYAVALARKFAATVHLLHVTAPDEAASPGAAHNLRRTANAVLSARERLARTHEKHLFPFWSENTHIRTGQSFHEICEQAREIDADLIVIGTRGNSGLKRVLLGSTAERVVRFAPCPILVVRKRRGRRWIGVGLGSLKKEITVRRILVPTDFSQCAMAGLMYGALWAKTFNAKLRLLHVLPPVVPVLIDRIPANLPSEQVSVSPDTQLEVEALTQLDFMRGVKCEPKIRIGYVTDIICGESDDADLLVISTHGRTGWRHAVIGSVAEQAIRYAECPVLVVPSRCAMF
jgi:nucleotide-binding universal stress UspA family protein